MAKIDAYFRSIERFAATGAVLTSGQSVTLRFSSGDRQATQVTPHDALVAMVREVSPPNALAAIDSARPARFEVESNGVRYSLGVTPKPGAWHVAIDPVSTSPLVIPSTTIPPATALADLAVAAIDPGKGLAIERGQYDDASDAVAPGAASGSVLLDQLTHAARDARATDIYLGSGVPATMRVMGEVRSMTDRTPLDSETLSRELGLVAPADVRSAWGDHGIATFAYGDGVGRVRATVVRDSRGPGAALRLLPGEPIALARLGAPPEVTQWLARRGLIFVAGASGAGKTTTVAAMVHALAGVPRRVIAFEVAIEIAHASAVVSQRRIGADVVSTARGIASAMLEGTDAIVVGSVDSSDTAAAIVSAVAGGHLVIATMVTTARDAQEQLIEMVSPDRRGLARVVVERGFIGAVGVTATVAGRSFEIVAGRER